MLNQIEHFNLADLVYFSFKIRTKVSLKPFWSNSFKSFKFHLDQLFSLVPRSNSSSMCKIQFHSDFMFVDFCKINDQTWNVVETKKKPSIFIHISWEEMHSAVKSVSLRASRQKKNMWLLYYLSWQFLCHNIFITKMKCMLFVVRKCSLNFN